MNTALFFVGFESPAEVAVAWNAVEQYRQSGKAPQNENPNNAMPLPPIDAGTSIMAERIYKGLTRAPLGPRYSKILATWYDAPAGQAVTIEDLGKKVGASLHELRASLSKLSGRMKRIATPEEAAALRTPFLLLADIEYDERNSSQHRLTAAGREAVRKYLKR